MKISSPPKVESVGANPGTKDFSELYYDKQDILQKFNISSRTLQRWRSDNAVTYTRIGGRYFYPKEQFAIEIRTIQQMAKEDSQVPIQEEPQSTQNNSLPVDTSTSHPNNIISSRSFAKLWDPIPGYLVPILIMFIYFTPFIKDFITGKPIDPSFLVMPLLMGSMGVTAFLLLRTAIAILKKISGRRRTS